MVLELWEILCFVAIAKTRNPPHGETSVNACTTKPLTHAQPNGRITGGQVMTMVELWVFLCFVTIAKTKNRPHGEASIDASRTNPKNHLGATFALRENQPDKSV